VIRAWLLAATLLLAATPVVAAPASDGVPLLRQHVTDLTGTLTAAQVSELEASLVALEQRKGSQMAVLMVPTTGEQAIETYSLAVVEKNKTGRAKVDDGLLLLIAKDDRKARIEVGYGLEGVVTDALASRVIREYLAPRFRQGDYFGGIRDASATLTKLVDGEALPAPMTSASESGDRGSPPFFFAVMLGLFVGLFAGGTGMKPVTLRRIGAGAVAGGLAWVIFSAGLSMAAAAVVAFLLSGSGGGRFGSGRGGFGSFPSGMGGWGGGGGSGGGGWSGGGGSFGGGGASGGW
jgi:uncharacterized protein